jgi:3-oxoacyl-[acyl-carrier protein] reductase
MTAAALLTGRVGVVTGAGRGIGRAVALALAERGMHLALVARTGAQVRELAEEVDARFGVPAFPAAVDVRDPAAVERLVAHVEQQLGTVDLLVNNAGLIEPVELPFWEVDHDDAWAVVETNVRGPMILCRALLPPMVQRGHGHVVNVSSRARAAQRTGTYTAYASSKRALSALTEGLASSLRGTGVVVHDVVPGLVRTSMTQAMPVWRDVPEEDWAPAEATALLVARIALGEYDDRAGELLDAVAEAGA